MQLSINDGFITINGRTFTTEAFELLASQVAPERDGTVFSWHVHVPDTRAIYRRGYSDALEQAEANRRVNEQLDAAQEAMFPRASQSDIDYARGFNDAVRQEAKHYIGFRAKPDAHETDQSLSALIADLEAVADGAAEADNKADADPGRGNDDRLDAVMAEGIKQAVADSGLLYWVACWE